jgi:hypothetical protein
MNQKIISKGELMNGNTRETEKRWKDNNARGQETGRWRRGRLRGGYLEQMDRQMNGW